MRVFVGGASGAIGTRLVPQLIEAGHDVTGTFRSPGGAERLRALGAKPVALDLLDARAVRKAVLASEPEAIVHEATALAELRFSRNSTAPSRRPTGFGPRVSTRSWPPHARRACPGSWPRATPAHGPCARVDGSRARTTRSTPPRSRARTRAGPRCATSTRRSWPPAGSCFATASSTARPTTAWSNRCAGGSSRSSATATGSPRSSTSTTPPRAPCWRSNRAEPGSTTSSTTSPPQRVSGCRCSRMRSGRSRPAAFRAGWRGCSRAGAATMMGTESRGASNAKAKRELGWELRYPSWRQGFVATYASTAPAQRRGAEPGARASHSPSRLST